MGDSNEIKVHITAENQQFLNKIQETINALNTTKISSENASQGVGGFLSKIANFSMVITGAYAGLSMFNTVIDNTIGAIGRYSMSMENNVAAFEVFLGSTQLATQYLNDLKKIAADTPFDLPGVTDAGKKLLAFGFDAQTSLGLLRSLGDASAGLGLGTEGLQRITLAIGQIKAKGRVLGDELLQLTEAGIPAYTILADKLHLTADQVKNIGDAGIDADTAIKALKQGIDEQFGGMAEKLSNKMMGLLTTIKDNAMNTGSFLMLPLFESLERGLVKVRDFSNKLSAAINGQGNIDENVGVLGIIVKIQVGLEKAKALFISFTELFGKYDDDGSFYFSQEALDSISKAGDFLERAWNFAVDIGTALVDVSPIVGAIIGRVGEWLEVIIKILDVIVNGVISAIGIVNDSFSATNVAVNIIVDTLMGFFVLEKIITMIQAMQTAFNLVKVAVTGVREAIKATSIAQAALNVLTGASKGPAGIAIALGASAAAVAAGYALEKSGVFDFDSLKGKTPNDGKAESELQVLLNKIKKQQTEIPQYNPKGKGSQDLDQSAKSKEAINQSQKELKIAIDSVSNWVKSANQDIDDQIEKLKLKNDQTPMDPKEYYNQLYSLEQQKAINVEAGIGQKINATNSALFEKELDRSYALQKYQEEAEAATKETAKLSSAINEIAGSMKDAQATFNKEGSTWRREVAGVNIEGLNEVALNGISAVSQKFFELTGKQMVVSSGRRDWGGHVSGNKFDVVDDGASTLLENNTNGIRDAIIDYAKSIGLKVLDEYSDPSARATAGHLDFDATNFTAKTNQIMKWQASDMLTKGGAEYRKALEALFDEGNKLLLQASKFLGSESVLDKAIINNKYDKLAQKFKNANLTHVVSAVEKIRSAELLSVDFKDTQKNLEYANSELVDYQENLYDDMADGSKTSAQATDDYIKRYHELFDNYIAELQKQLEDANSIGDKESVIKIKEELKNLINKITDGINAIIKRIDDNLNDEIARINANADTTTMQKQEAIDSARRKAATDKVEVLKQDLSEKILEDSKSGKNNNADNIKEIQQQILLNEKLAETPTLLDKIHRASKQAFEDGLLDFLEKGILECKSFGDAVRNLAITILQSIQKVNAQAMTKRLMQSFGLGDDGGGSSSSSGSNYSFDFNGFKTLKFASGGHVVGEGTGTSDSILAKLSNGEYVVKADAVRRVGVDFLNRVNSGDVYNMRIPLPKFATGGLVGKTGADSASKGMDLFTANIGNNVSTTIPLSVALVSSQEEAMTKFLNSRQGQKLLLDFNKNNGKLISRTLRL